MTQRLVAKEEKITLFQSGSRDWQSYLPPSQDQEICQLQSEIKEHLAAGRDSEEELAMKRC